MTEPKPRNKTDPPPYLAAARALRSQLQRAGLSQLGAARELRIGGRTMRGYVSGHKRIPMLVTYAMCWLKVRDRIAGEMAEWRTRHDPDG